LLHHLLDECIRAFKIKLESDKVLIFKDRDECIIPLSTRIIELLELNSNSVDLFLTDSSSIIHLISSSSNNLNGIQSKTQ